MILWYEKKTCTKMEMNLPIHLVSDSISGCQLKWDPFLLSLLTLELCGTLYSVCHVCLRADGLRCVELSKRT